MYHIYVNILAGSKDRKRMVSFWEKCSYFFSFIPIIHLFKKIPFQIKILDLFL